MARRTKEKFDIEVQAALEAALDIDFDENAEETENNNAVREDKSAEAFVSNFSESAQTQGQSYHISFSDNFNQAPSEAEDSDSADAQSGTKAEGESDFFSFKEKEHYSDEESLSDFGKTENDIFDLKNLEQQIVSASEELNKAGNARKLEQRDADKALSAENTEGNAPEEAEGNYLADEAEPEKKRKYIILGGTLSPSGRASEAPETKDSAEQSGDSLLEGNNQESHTETDDLIREISDAEHLNQMAAQAEQKEGDENTPPSQQVNLAEEQQNLAKFLREEQDPEKESKRQEEAVSFAPSPFAPSGSAPQGQSNIFSQNVPPAPPSGKRPNLFRRSPLYWGTAAVSALWAAGGAVIAYKLAEQSNISLPVFMTSAQGLLAAAGTIIPIFMFWGFAQLAHRAKELQNIVQTMTGAAMRLIEPETASKESISNLGQTIRREVAAMDAGIDRTMSRASELEALLQNEVTNLERSYGENEVRIRSLIAELANEREAVATHADNVKAKITGAKDQLTQEFTSIADHINATAESFTIALSETLNSRWNELVNEFNNANEDVARQLSQKFIDTVQNFDASRGQFFEELDSRFSQIDAHTDAATKAVAERLGEKMDDFVKIVQERTEEVEGRFDSLSGRLAESGNKIIDSVNGSVSEIEQRTEDIEERLQSTSDKVLDSFDDKFNHLDEAVIERSARSLKNFSEQINRLEASAQNFPALFDQASKTASTAFNKHMETAEQRFLGLSDRLTKSGAILSETISRNVEEAEKSSDEMDARLSMSSKAVMEVFENKLSALDSLFVDKSSHSLELYAEQVQKLEKKSDSLSADFNSATQDAVRHFEKRLDEVDNLLSHKSTSLIRSFIEKTESLETSTEKLNTALEVHVERVNEAFRSRASDITESLTNGRNDILSIVDETKTRLSREMEIVGATIGKLVDERAGGFIYQFIEGREKLSQTLQEETGRIVTTVGEQMGRLSAYVADIEKNLLSRVEEVDSHAHAHVEQLDEKTSEFERSITNSFGLTRQLIETQARNLDARAQSLKDSLTLNSKELHTVLGQQAAALEERIASIRRVVAESDGAFTDAMRNHVAAFGKSVAAGDEELRRTFLTHLQNLENQTGRLKDSFSEGQLALSESLEEKMGALQSMFANEKISIETLLDKHGNVISEKAVHLQDNLAQTLADVDEKLGKQSEILDKRAYDLRDAVDYNSTVLSDSFLRQTSIIDERTKTMQKTLEIGVDNVRTALENNAVSLSDTLKERLNDVSSALSVQTEKAGNLISVASDKLLNSVFSAADNVDNKLAQRGLAISNALSDAGGNLDSNMSNIQARLAEIAASLEAEANKAGAVINEAGGRLSNSVIQSAQAADKVFAERSSDLQNNLKMVEGRLNYGLQAIQDQMLGTTNEVEDKLNDRSQTFKDDLLKIGGEIGSGVDTIRERIAELTHSATQELVDKTNNLHSLTEQLKNAATRTSDSLANLTGTFSKQLHEVTQAAEERLRQENENFVSTFSERTEDAVSAVQNARTELERQIGRLLEGLENSSSSIQLTVGGLHNNVDEVDKKLGDLTSQFRQNISELSENFRTSGDVLNRDLERFNGQSNDALDKIAKFSEQFNSHAGLLMEATNVLENSDNLLSEKLSGNQESLNRLVDGLVAKSNEIADAMHDCETIIVSTIKNVEDKTYSSADDLRSSLTALINEAAGRFEGATGEIRKAADDIRSELERTKADLGRGMRSLPIQTKEYTDAMRKAVMDQIEALKDLSGIVEESGLLFDVTKPQASASAAARAQAARPAASSARAAPISSDSARRSNAFTPSNASANDMGSSRPFASYAAPRASQPAPSIADNIRRAGSETGDAKNGNSRGWVSNLLARASKEDNARPAGASVNPITVGSPRNDTSASANSLNSMSADIVQAIDRDGIAKLWQHYRRGQRNIAPDKLYTPEGYRIFEDIKHKYAYDGEFRRAVGQYISDFEHLLGDVTKNGGNNGTVRDYLTSDTGKVYTMLAHVSGRIQ